MDTLKLVKQVDKGFSDCLGALNALCAHKEVGKDAANLRNALDPLCARWQAIAKALENEQRE